MASNVIDTKDIEEHDQEVRARRRRHRRETKGSDLKDLSFEALTPAQRDRLLKAVAIKLGLIQDSEDP